MVLAGGASRRFGVDKLSADLAGWTLLERAIDRLPAAAAVIVVGPPRTLTRSVRWVREEPAGGGPAAAMVAGFEAALDLRPDTVLVLPGDTPGAGAGAAILLEALSSGSEWAVQAADEDGRGQPLQLALRASAVESLIALAGPRRAAGESARRWLAGLNPAPRLVRLAPDALADIDTPADLRAWIERG